MPVPLGSGGPPRRPAVIPFSPWVVAGLRARPAVIPFSPWVVAGLRARPAAPPRVSYRILPPHAAKPARFRNSRRARISFTFSAFAETGGGAVSACLRGDSVCLGQAPCCKRIAYAWTRMGRPGALPAQGRSFRLRRTLRRSCSLTRWPNRSMLARLVFALAETRVVPRAATGGAHRGRGGEQGDIAAFTKDVTRLLAFDDKHVTHDGSFPRVLSAPASSA